jgi:hypothetical protein
MAATTAVLSGVLLAGCGSGSAAGPQAHQSTAGTTPSPTAPPTTGTYPAYPHADYDYTLRTTCFCANAGVPYRITVRAGKVVKVVYAARGRGHQAGEAIGDSWLRVTIAQVIARANDTRAAQVDVTWPAGQDYPSSVYVDQDKQAADEEIGYAVSNVVPLV